jgi:hypothetical protein
MEVKIIKSKPFRYKLDFSIPLEYTVVFEGRFEDFNIKMDTNYRYMVI